MATAAVALSLALAACGGGDDGGNGGSADSFKSDFRAQRTALQALGKDIVTELQQADQKSDEQLAGSFATLAERTEAAVKALDGLDPTEGIEDDLTKLEAAFTTVAKDLRGIASAAEKGDADAAAKSTQALTEHAQDVEQAIDAIAKELGLPLDPQTSQRGGKVNVVFQQPANRNEAIAKQILEVGGPKGVGEGFSTSFVLPTDITLRAVSGFVGPNYDPSTKTITLSYGFVDYTAGILRKGLPNISEEQLGEQLAAVNSFIAVHEFGHAFVDLYELPITGREEDAVDQLATVFMTDFVKGGDQYALYAARFFKFLFDDRGALSESDYWNEHSLDIQRAYDIVCLVAGSSEKAFSGVAQLRVLGPDRLRRCPSEYQQKSSAWKKLLQPHTRD